MPGQPDQNKGVAGAPLFGPYRLATFAATSGTAWADAYCLFRHAASSGFQTRLDTRLSDAAHFSRITSFRLDRK